MAKGRKTGGRDFPKGHQIRTLPKDVKEMMQVTKEDYARAVHKLSKMTLIDFQIAMNDHQNVTVAEKIIGTFLHAAMRDEDPKRINMLFDRVLGPVVIPSGAQGQNQGNTVNLIIPSNGRELTAKEPIEVPNFNKELDK